MENATKIKTVSRTQAIIRLVLVSGIGIVLFFFPFKISSAPDAQSSIFIDHVSILIQKHLGSVLPFYILALMLYGAIKPFVTKKWNVTITETIMSFLKIVGVVLCIMFIAGVGPAAFYEPDMLPFIFNRLILSLAIVIPVGGGLLLLVTDYGLMEFVGVFARPIMRPVYNLPGRAAVGAVASFMGSYSLGLIITDNEYKENKYSSREAFIVATGFSTVSATFMVVVAKNLDIMAHWSAFFWGCLLVVFLVTAITIRLPPYRKYKDFYYNDGTPEKEIKIEAKGFTNKIKAYCTTAATEGVNTAAHANPVAKSIVSGFIAGIKMTSSTLPSMMSVALIGLMLQKHTPVFDYFGLIFYPITKLLGLADARLVATAVSTSIAEMLLPAALGGGIASLATRYVIAIVCVSEILFFSASIPCMLATEVPMKVSHLVLIWFWRVVFSLIIATPLAYLLFGMG